MKQFAIGLMIIGACITINYFFVGCDNLPFGSNEEIINIIITNDSDIPPEHPPITSNESCGTAAERSGCHSGEIIVTR